MISASPQSSQPKPSKNWSLAKRFLGITVTVVIAQSLISLVITRQLRKYFQDNLHASKLTMEVVTPLSHINDQLDQFTAERAVQCCNETDYQSLIEDLQLYDGKAGMIYGQAGMAVTRGSLISYDKNKLKDFAARAINADDGFVIVDLNLNKAVALKAIKLPGGDATGHFIFLRPVYSKPLMHTQSIIKLLSELTLLAITTITLMIVAKKLFSPFRSISESLAAVELNKLETAQIKTDNAPTELLPILNEFNNMVGRLQESASNQKQFASTISHEFRTPITVVSGFIQSVLNRSEELSDRTTTSLNIANQEALRLNRMLSDLLDLSRADNNQLSTHRETFNISTAVQQALKMAHATHPNPISDNLDPEDSLFAIGDHDRLVQCLENLIGNAVKYSEPAAPIHIDLHQVNTRIQLAVKDHGQGIAPDQQALIFQRFTRAKGVNLPRGQTSSGLGLSIVKMFVEAMGGAISVASVVGEGSTFTIDLEAAKTSPQS